MSKNLIHNDEPSFSTVWPPPGSTSMVAVVTPQDTRDGWIRVTWCLDGRIVVQGSSHELMALVPEDQSQESVLAWARSYRFGTIHAP